MKDGKWWDKSWNPISGCDPCSVGCKYCWAREMANRFNGGDFSVKLHPEKLNIPLHWKNPRRIFVCSMSDIFHPKVPFEFIDKVFGIIDECPQHKFLILTKRPDIALNYYNRYVENIDAGISEFVMSDNIWTGVSISTQKKADEKIPILLEIPAAVRYVSLEPLLEYIDFREEVITVGKSRRNRRQIGYPILRDLDWVIVGCESINGRAGRGCEDEGQWWSWARDIIKHCKAAGIAVFMKQGPIGGKVCRDIDKFPAFARIREWSK